MSMCPKQYVDYMHEYLDGDISLEHGRQLEAHLQTCDECQQHMHELTETIAFVKSASPIFAPDHLQSQIISQLPARTIKVPLTRWLRRHPVIVAAAIFCVFMGAALLGNVSNSIEYVVGNDANILVDGQTVIVPKGEVIEGNLLVKNGNVRIDGEVDGDVTVINGKYMASSAVVTGKVEEIDKAFEWV